MNRARAERLPDATADLLHAMEAILLREGPTKLERDLEAVRKELVKTHGYLWHREGWII